MLFYYPLLLQQVCNGAEEAVAGLEECEVRHCSHNLKARENALREGWPTPPIKSLKYMFCLFVFP